jgi:hypothetical protein
MRSDKDDRNFPWADAANIDSPTERGSWAQQFDMLIFPSSVKIRHWRLAI